VLVCVCGLMQVCGERVCACVCMFPSLYKCVKRVCEVKCVCMFASLYIQVCKEGVCSDV